MRTRWKLFLVFLLIALVPVLVMHVAGQQAVLSLGRDLGVRTKAVLIERGRKELLRLVEDHARVLKRERELAEMALWDQDLEIEKALAGPPADGPLSGKLAAAGPVLGQIREKLSRLIFRQMTALSGGSEAVVPATEGRWKDGDARKSDWYVLAAEKGAMVWSGPRQDQGTGMFLMTVSSPLAVSGKGFSGVTAIEVPVDAFLHENEHILNISRRVTSLLVRAEEGRIRVVAEEDETQAGKRHMRPASGRKWLGPFAGGEYGRMLANLSDRRTGVREMDFEGLASFFAYAPTDDLGTALLLIVPEQDMTQGASEMERAAIFRADRLASFTALVLAGLLALVGLGALVLSRAMTKNMGRIVAASRRLAEGDFSARADIRARDEMGEMGRTFDAMVPALAERLRLKQSMRVAKEVQQSLLPAGSPLVPGLDVAGDSRFCDETGGDYYDFIPMQADGRPLLGVVVGDVAEHGIPSALLMASIRGALRQRSLMPGPLALMAGDANRQFSRDVKGTGRFMTLLFLSVDPVSREISWVRAGHDPGLLYDPASDSFLELDGGGPALGVLDDATYTESSTKASSGQVLVLFTDGVWEARDEAGKAFGKPRLKDLIRANAGKRARDLVECVIASVEQFQGTCTREDDLTVVAVRFL